MLRTQARLACLANPIGVLVSIVILSTGAALADGKITGKVTAADGAPLRDVRIILTPEKEGGGRLASKTNKKGEYFFGLVPKGRYTLVVEGTDLVPHSIKIRVYDTEKRQEVDTFQGAPSQKPHPFDIDISLDVTYDLVLGDADKAPAALAKREAEMRVAAQKVPDLLRAGDYDAALTHIDEALKIKPDDAELHYFKGYALFRKKEYGPAKNEITRALELNPSQVGGHFLLGGILSELGQKAEALGEFERELAGNTDQVGKINSLVNVGLINRELGNKEKAIEAFEKVIELDAKQSEAYSYLADLYLASGKPDKAAEVQARGKALGVEDPKAVFNLGANYWNSKEYEKAEASFRHAVEIDPSFALAWKSLGYALVNLGKPAEAAEALAKYLELSPQATDAEDVKEMIDAIGKDRQAR